MSDDCGRATPATRFITTVLVLATLGYLPWVLSSYGIMGEEFVFLGVILGGASPTIAALTTAKHSYGRAGQDKIFKAIGRPLPSKWWLAAAVGVPLGIATLSAAIYFWFKNLPVANELPYYELLPLILANLAYNMWEELGWRGFLLPHYQETMAPGKASLSVAAVQVAWHWPHLAVKDSQMLGNFGGFFAFVVFTIFFAFACTWVYNRSNGNWLVPGLMHAGFNGANMFWFSLNGIAGVDIMPIYLPVFAVSLGIIYLRASREGQSVIVVSEILGQRD
jgi:hypothetical protein